MKDKQIKSNSIEAEGFAAEAGYESSAYLRSALERMREEDIRNVDPESLSELTDIEIDNALPVKERVKSLLKQTRNPYCFKYNGMIVKTSFAGKQTIEDCIATCFFTE